LLSDCEIVLSGGVRIVSVYPRRRLAEYYLIRGEKSRELLLPPDERICGKTFNWGYDWVILSRLSAIRALPTRDASLRIARGGYLGVNLPLPLLRKEGGITLY
jgi:hypothetical protein